MSLLFLQAVNVLKFPTLLFTLQNNMLVIMARILKMLIRLANGENPYHTASSEAV